ncbi:MAG: hypothetical protein O7B99_04165, partial [Planctomycetota bacterium]|nr:hypothetical protein [Planctomycetota bacterium]
EAQAGMDAMGMRFEDRPDEEIAGLHVRRFRITIDPEALTAMMGAEPGKEERAQMVALQSMTMLYGAEGMRYGLAADDDRVLMAMGGDPAWLKGAVERFAHGGGEVPADLRRVAGRVGGGSATFLVRIQLARFMSQVMGMMSGMMGLTPQESPFEGLDVEAPVVLGVGFHGRTWRLSLSTDPVALAAFVEAAEDL